MTRFKPLRWTDMTNKECAVRTVRWSGALRGQIIAKVVGIYSSPEGLKLDYELQPNNEHVKVMVDARNVVVQDYEVGLRVEWSDGQEREADPMFRQRVNRSGELG